MAGRKDKAGTASARITRANSGHLYSKQESGYTLTESQIENFVTKLREYILTGHSNPAATIAKTSAAAASTFGFPFLTKVEFVGILGISAVRVQAWCELLAVISLGVFAVSAIIAVCVYLCRKKARDRNNVVGWALEYVDKNYKDELEVPVSTLNNFGNFHDQ